MDVSGETGSDIKLEIISDKWTFNNDYYFLLTSSDTKQLNLISYLKNCVY